MISEGPVLLKVSIQFSLIEALRTYSWDASLTLLALILL